MRSSGRAGSAERVATSGALSSETKFMKTIHKVPLCLASLSCLHVSAPFSAPTPPAVTVSGEGRVGVKVGIQATTGWRSLWI